MDCFLYLIYQVKPDKSDIKRPFAQERFVSSTYSQTAF